MVDDFGDEREQKKNFASDSQQMTDRFSQIISSASQKSTTERDNSIEF